MSDDAVLWNRWARERDEAAFALLARRHADLVADVAFRAAGGDRARAEDALQEALLALARERSDRPALVGVRAWLARAAMTRALHARASDRARARRERAAGARRTEDAMGTDGASAAEAVRAAMADVGGEDAAVLAMRFLHGMEYGELARVLDVAEPTARVRVHRAMERLRAAARRDDADEGTVARALAALPTFAAPAAVVESAVASAVAASAAATIAATSTARWLVGLAAVAVAATGGFVAYRTLDDRDAAGPEERTIERSSDGSPGRPALVGRATSESEAPMEESTPPADLAVAGLLPTPKPAPPRGPPAPLLAPTPGARGALRVEIVRADGRIEEVPVSRVTAGGTTWAPSAASPGWRLETKPGALLSLLVDDPRAAVQGIVVTVPDPVPATITVRVPSKDDPRLERLVLEIVDAQTGAPLPDARLEWGDDDMPARTQHADAQGRIVVSFPHRPEVLPLLRFTTAERWIHAPGHQGLGWVRGSAELLLLGGILRAEDLSALLERGVLPVPLVPTAGNGMEDRAVRIVEADGRAAADAFVHVVHPSPEGGTALREVYGFRRADAEGLLSFPIRDVVGIEVRRRGEPVASWLLARDSWPASGPRDLRLPAVADVELTVLDLPDGQSGAWSLDPLGAKRTPLDASATEATTDPDVERLLAGRSMYVSFLPGASGTLKGPRATARFFAPVGSVRRVHLAYGEGHRTWDVRADGPAPIRLERAWRDLPLDEGDAPLIVHYPELDTRR